MFHKKATLMLMILSTAFISIRCQEKSTLSDNKNDREVSAIRECFTKCLESKIDMSLYTTDIYLGIMCEKYRMRKIEFACDKQLSKIGYDYKAADLIKACLTSKSAPSTYDYYFIQGKKLQKAREFMKKEFLAEIPPQTPKQESSVEKLELNPKPKTNKETSIQNLLEDFDINNLPEVTDYSTFADGLCYDRYIFNSNPNQETACDVNCLIPCVAKLFIETERILIEEFSKIEKPTDNPLKNFQPEADIFEIVCRLTGVKTTEKFTKLGEKWLINYTTAYQNIKIHHREKIGKVESALKVVMNSYVECFQNSCTANFKATKSLLFYDWMDTTSKLDDSHYYDANDNSKMLRGDSHAYRDSYYHDANDNSNMLEDSSTNRIYKLDLINEIADNQNRSDAQNKSAKKKPVDDPIRN